MNEDITKQADDLALRAEGLTIVDRATAEKADLLIALGKDMIKKVRDFFRPLKQAQDEAKRQLLRAEELELLRVEPIVKRLDQSLSSWQMEERRKAREIDEKRLADERRRKELEEETLRKAEVAAPEDQDRILAEAAAEERGFEAPPPVAAAPRVMANSFSRLVWKFRVQ